LATLLEEVKGHVICIGCTNLIEKIDPQLRRFGRFDKEIRIEVPNEEERFEILCKLASEIDLSCDVDLKSIS
jgi:SpoVK/Ycf46/Vps4 family AAA+-type ATPase